MRGRQDREKREEERAATDEGRISFTSQPTRQPGAARRPRVGQDSKSLRIVKLSDSERHVAASKDFLSVTGPMVPEECTEIQYVLKIVPVKLFSCILLRDRMLNTRSQF